MGTFRLRLALAMRDKKYTAKDVWPKIKVSRAAYYKWCDSTHASCRGDTLFRLADLLGVNSRWLALGKGPQHPVTPYTSDQHSIAQIWPKLPESTRHTIQLLVNDHKGTTRPFELTDKETFRPLPGASK